MPKKRAKRGPAKGTPSYCRHRDAKRGDRAFVLLNGKRKYLGAYGSRESKAAYDRVVAEFLANGRKAPQVRSKATTVLDLVLAYWDWAKAYYVRADGSSTGTAELKVRYAIRDLGRLFGSSAASDFGPKDLDVLRTHMIETRGLARNVVNQRISIVKQLFRWAEAEEKVPGGTYHRLSTLAPLKPGRTKARETEPVRPARWSDVAAALEHLSPTISAMVQLQNETAMRPGEVCAMRACDIEKFDDGMWIYSPPAWKNAHKGMVRQIPLFERSQELLQPFLADIEVGKDPATFLFRPKGHRARHDRYSTTHYAQAVKRGIAAANAPGQQEAILAAILPMVPEEAHERLSRAVRRLVTNMELSRVANAIERQAERCGFNPAPVVGEAERALSEHEDDHLQFSPNQIRHAAATRIERQLSVEEARIVLGHTKGSRATATYIEPDVQSAFDKLRKLG